MKWTLRKSEAIVGLLLLAALSGCRSSSEPTSAAPGLPHLSQPTVETAAQFTDITDSSGVKFEHFNGTFGKKWMPETTGGGCAFIDYDKDGKEDILLVDSGQFKSPSAAYPSKSNGSRVSLYHNLGGGKFKDVSATSGLAVLHYGQGVCVGDYDNDGWQDVYVTCLGPNYLFRNKGNGKFEDVTSGAGVAGTAVNGSLQWKWSSSCAWLDYDKDGRLDLFVCNFVEWSPSLDVFCGTTGGRKDYCAPDAYKGLPNTLYHQNRDGTFTDVSVPTQISEFLGKAWGIAVWDFNNDGWLDVAIANDRQPNFFFLNHEGKYFSEDASWIGIALSESGHSKSGMGIDVADWNNDGRDALLIGNFSNEKLSLYTPDAPNSMTDIADRTGLGLPSLKFLTFGCMFLDYDLDGRQDVFAANGHIQEFVEEFKAGITYRERPLLYHNNGKGAFDEVAEKSGRPFQEQYVLRGCATADVDEDGDLDILVVENNGPALLWRNDLPKANHWVRIALTGAGSNRDGIGALITVNAGGIRQRQWVKSGTSFLSQSSLRPTFGLGSASKIDSIEVLWPNGLRETFPAPGVDRVLSLVEHKGIAR